MPNDQSIRSLSLMQKPQTGPHVVKNAVALPVTPDPYTQALRQTETVK